MRFGTDDKKDGDLDGAMGTMLQKRGLKKRRHGNLSCST